MKKKIVSALLVSTMVATAFAGCGSKAEETTDTAATESTDASAEESSTDDAIANLIAATEGTVNIDLWCSETEEYQTVMKKLCDDFAAQYPDVDFNITLGAVSEADMKDRVLEDVEAAADVFVFPDDQLEALVKAGALNEVAAQYTYDMNETDTAATVEAGQYDGKQYGYPFTASNGYFLYYDKNQLSDEDVASWEALTAKAEELGIKTALEAVRLAPSAVNKQPWRVVVTENAAHFYEKKDKGYDNGTYDLQKADLGIALYHFENQCREEGKKVTFKITKSTVK